MGEAQQFAFPYGMVMGQIFMILGVPVALGLLLRRKAPTFTKQWHSKMSLLATVLFVVIVVAAVAKNWAIFKANAITLAPLVLCINVAMLALGFGLSKLAGVPLRQAATVAIESSVQNGTLAIVIASTILMNDTMMLPRSRLFRDDVLHRDCVCARCAPVCATSHGCRRVGCCGRHALSYCWDVSLRGNPRSETPCLKRISPPACAETLESHSHPSHPMTTHPPWQQLACDWCAKH